MPTPKILAFAGSTRKDSYNKKLVQIAAAGAREAGAEVTYLDLRDYPLPIYDGDQEAAEGLPADHFAPASTGARLYTPSTSITFLEAMSFRSAELTTEERSPLRKADFPSDLRMETTSERERISPSPSFSRMSGVMLVDGVTIPA